MCRCYLSRFVILTIFFFFFFLLRQSSTSFQASTSVFAGPLGMDRGANWVTARPTRADMAVPAKKGHLGPSVCAKVSFTD